MALTDGERRAIKRRDYAWYKAHGVCVGCHQADARPGRVRCAKCEAKIAKAHDRNHDLRVQQMADRRARLIAAGTCITCGRRPATHGMIMCPICRDKARDSNRKWRILQRMDREANEARRRNHG